MDQEEWTETLQLPKPDWACKHEKPANMEPYAGRRIYAEAKPDRLGSGEAFQIPGLSRAFQGSQISCQAVRPLGCVGSNPWCDTVTTL